VPLHLQKCFADLGYWERSLPATEQACREVLSLPVYPEMTADEQELVIESIADFCQGRAKSAA
jgi:dTDP-4-amino-4,6-dideoxygalactose transaminase